MPHLIKQLYSFHERGEGKLKENRENWSFLDENKTSGVRL